MRNLIACSTLPLLLMGCYFDTGPKPAAASPVVSAAAPYIPPPSDAGHFVIVHSPHIESDTMLLDTETGQTWQLMSEPRLNGDPLVWEPISRIDALSDRTQLVALYGLKPGSPAAPAGNEPGPTTPAQ